MSNSLLSMFQSQGFAVIPQCLDGNTIARLVHLTELARANRGC